MNSKALRKQLLAAVAMVIVAAIAVSSSTFAWFAGNNVVTAQNMKVQAIAEDGIEIKYDTQAVGAYSSANASALTNAMVLYPTSTQKGATWVHANAAAATAFTAAAGSYTSLALSTGDPAEEAYGYAVATMQDASQKYDAAGKQYYRVDKFNIRTVQGTLVAQKVKVKEVTVTGTPAALDQSLRVLITNSDGTVWYNYNAGNGSATRNVATTVTSSGAVGNPATIAAVSYAANNAASTLLCTCAAATQAAAGTAQDVYIYTYYEGEDVNHYSNNLDGALAELNITVTFEADNTVGNFVAPSAPAAAYAAQQAGTAAIN